MSAFDRCDTVRVPGSAFPGEVRLSTARVPRQEDRPRVAPLSRPSRSRVLTESLFPQVFPLFHALGANGLLLEYEDMFPYDGRLRLLRAKHAYRYPQPQREQGHRRCRRLGEGLAPVGSPLLAFRLLSELQK